MTPWKILGAVLVGASCGASMLPAADADPRPFAIRVVDKATDRGVPLVVLKTTNAQSFVTDSAGMVAIDEPDLLGRRVFFLVSSHGYEFPADGFGFRGKAIDVTPGGEAVLSVKRVNIAERLYRVTGGGIYIESAKLGREAPIKTPNGAGGVMGQDSVQAAKLGNRIHWFWGDTSQLKYPLGQFRTSGATSLAPAEGGLDPSVGVDLSYYTDENGFCRSMFAADGPGVVWLDGLCVATDAAGSEHLLGHFSRREGLAKQLAHGIAEFDVGSGRFVKSVDLPEETRLHPQGQATRVASDDDAGYLYFATPYPSLRVRAGLTSALKPEDYEGFTPLAAGSRPGDETPEVERDEAGRVVYSWKRGAQPLSADDEHKLIERGLLKPEEARWQTVDAATGERVLLQAGSVRWNKHRQRWVMIAVQGYGKPSFLGEVWYVEAKQLEGPWTNAVRIVTHDQYSFYNPVQHEFFDQQGGRVIYFEGTYTHTFSGNPSPTPRYDYNQVMYRLDLDDARLAPARVE